MKNYINPFEYEAANKLSSEQILDFYIEDFNYTRFINSRRNVYLIGERGTGKSMTLLYNSLNVQYDKALRNITEFKFDTLCIYVPCNTTLIHKREYELIEKYKASGQLKKLSLFNEFRNDCFLELSSSSSKYLYNTIPLFSSYITSYARIQLMQNLIKYENNILNIT